MPALPPHRPARPLNVPLVLVLAALAACTTACEFSERRLPYGNAPGAQVARGKLLLAQYQCGSCHAIPEVPIARGVTGPSLTAFGRRSYIAGHLPNQPDTLARWIVAPATLVPDTVMPSMGVSPEDARDMAAYLLALE